MASAQTPGEVLSAAGEIQTPHEPSAGTGRPPAVSAREEREPDVDGNLTAPGARVSPDPLRSTDRYRLVTPFKLKL